jgi:hypothetical protein
MNQDGGVEGFGVGGEAVGKCKKILEFEVVSGVEAARQDVDHRHRQAGAAGLAAIAGESGPEGFAAGGGEGPGEGATDSKQSICAEAGLVLSAVGLDHPLVYGGRVFGGEVLE